MQQIVEIPLNGVSTTPSDYASPEGDLAFTSGVSNTKGSWQPLPSASKIQSMPEGYRLLYVHHGTSGCINGICLKASDNKLYWASMDDKNKFVKTEGEITWHALGVTFDVSKNHIVSLGNVITILTNEPVKHMIFKDDSYKDFEPIYKMDISFQLKGKYDSYSSSSKVKVKENASSELVYNTLKANGVIQKQSSSDNNFNLPCEITKNRLYKVKATFYFNDETMGMPFGVRINTFTNELVATGEVTQYKNREMMVVEAYFKAHENFSMVKLYPLIFVLRGEESVTLTAIQFYGFTEVGIEVYEGDEIQNPFYISPESNDILKMEINSFVDTFSIKKNRFIYPFLLRYGFEMFDGSITYASSPILMLPNTNRPITVELANWDDGKSEEYTLRLGGMTSSLKMTILDTDKLKTIKNNSLIKNFVIACTPQIYTMEHSWDADKYVEVESVNENSEEDNFSYTSSSIMIGEDDGSTFKKRGAKALYRAMIDKSSYAQADIPVKRWKDVIESLENSTYHIIKKIQIEEFDQYSFADIELDDNTIATIDSFPQLDVKSLYYNKRIAQNAFVYNSRLNLANITEVLFNGTNISLQNCKTEYSNIKYIYRIVVNYIMNEQTREMIIPFDVDNETDLSWFFVPYKATSCTIFRVDPIAYGIRMPYKAELILREHPFLDGSYAIADSFKGFKYDECSKDEFQMINRILNVGEDIEEQYISSPNKLALSNVSNPLTYDLNSVINVGTGKILAMTSANRPVSEGQFGQYPVYAFTTHGVWALEVNADGTYAAPKPITRDVVTNTKSITQIDDAVVFVSKRGLMLLSGGQSQCLTENLDDTYNIVVPTKNITGSDVNVTINPKEILQGCSIIYDYPNQRLICYNSDKTEAGVKIHPYAMVYSIKNHQWSYIVNDINYDINSYPDALVITDDGWMRDMTETDVANSTQAIIYSRPFRISETDYKTINEVRINGVVSYNNVKLLLQASNDLLNWQSVGSSNSNTIQNRVGTPYRWFRLLIVATLGKTHSLSSFSVKFTEKDDAQLISH